MKKNNIFAAFAAVALMVVAFVIFAPCTNTEAAKKKLPKNGQKFYSSTFEEHLGKGHGNGYWIVTKKSGTKKYQPVVEKNGVVIHCSEMYCQIGKYTYWCDKNGYVSKKNPDGYETSKYLYVIFPKEEKEDTKPADNTNKNDNKDSNSGSSNTKIDGKYTIKKNGDMIICVDQNGSWVNGWVGEYYFTSYGGMAIGLTYIDGEYYYFSDDISDFGKVKKNCWINGMYFDKKTGVALKDQKITIDGKVYCLDSNGYLVTGWHNGEFYSSEPDRYGQLVPGVTK